MNYYFLGKKKTLWFFISILIMIPGIIALFTWKLPLGIDFRGGSVAEIQFAKPVSDNALREKASTYPELKGVTVSSTGDQTHIIKSLPISGGDVAKFEDRLKKDFGNFTVKSFETVGPTVSADLTRKAFIAVVLAALLIILYLAYSFRGVTHPVSSWRFGLIAVAALLHDLLITVGVFAIVAHFFKFEIDASFITAMLTVMGFSVHDTIVVFDRVRENILTHQYNPDTEFEKIVDESLSQTLNRSLATSLTVIFTLVALTVLGGETIRPFIVTLLIGITIGTYSSIFTASPLLAVWQERVMRRGRNA